MSLFCFLHQEKILRLFFVVVQTSHVERQERCLEFVHDLNMLMMTSFVRLTYEGVVSKALTPCGAKNNVFAY